MTDDPDRGAEQRIRGEREADLVAVRLKELRENPLPGDFDAAHLKAIHAHIFQDLPHHKPGVVREDTESWVKHRALEGHAAGYDVHYAHKDIEKRIDGILRDFGGASGIKGLSPEDAGNRMAKLYGDLDHAHGFYEGNSRTLREFTRELSGAAGFELDWVRTDIGAKERNGLYIARDIEVLDRAFPNLTPERALKTSDRSEYEASFILTGLRQAAGDRTLDAIIRDRIAPQRSMEQIKPFEQGQERSAVPPEPAKPQKQRNDRPEARHPAYAPEQEKVPPRSAKPQQHDRLGAQPLARKPHINVSDKGFKVLDAKGVVTSLVGFLENLFGMGASPSSPDQQKPPQTGRGVRDVDELWEEIYEAVQRGNSLPADAIRHLPPAELENLRQHGDAHINNMIMDMERQKAKDQDYSQGRERGR